MKNLIDQILISLESFRNILEYKIQIYENLENNPENIEHINSIIEKEYEKLIDSTDKHPILIFQNNLCYLRDNLREFTEKNNIIIYKEYLSELNFLIDVLLDMKRLIYFDPFNISLFQKIQIISILAKIFLKNYKNNINSLNKSKLFFRFKNLIYSFIFFDKTNHTDLLNNEIILDYMFVYILEKHMDNYKKIIERNIEREKLISKIDKEKMLYLFPFIEDVCIFDTKIKNIIKVTPRLLDNNSIIGCPSFFISDILNYHSVHKKFYSNYLSDAEEDVLQNIFGDDFPAFTHFFSNYFYIIDFLIVRSHLMDKFRIINKLNNKIRDKNFFKDKFNEIRISRKMLMLIYEEINECKTRNDINNIFKLYYKFRHK